MIELVRSGRTLASLAKEFGVTDMTIRSWVRQADLDSGRRTDGLTTEEKQELGGPGFFMGIVHGLVAPIALVASIFSDVRIYAFPNGGGWYDFGFLLGISAWGGGAAASRR